VNELKERLPNTAVLFLASFTLTTIIGISVGVYTASKRGTFADNFVTGAGLFAYAVPTFLDTIAVTDVIWATTYRSCRYTAL